MYFGWCLATHPEFSPLNLARHQSSLYSRPNSPTQSPNSIHNHPTPNPSSHIFIFLHRLPSKHIKTENKIYSICVVAITAEPRRESRRSALHQRSSYTYWSASANHERSTTPHFREIMERGGGQIGFWIRISRELKAVM